MGQPLSTATTVLDLVALATSLGLGLYILTRNPRSLFSWLAALSLFALAVFFLHNALLINQPDSRLLPWLRPVILLAAVLFFHLTVLWRLGQMRGRGAAAAAPAGQSGLRGRLAGMRDLLARLAVAAAYAVALFLSALSILNYDSTAMATDAGDINRPGWPFNFLFLAIAAFIMILGLLSLYNLWQGFHSERSLLRRRQLIPILAGTSLAILGALYLTVGIWLQIDLPAFPRDLAIAAGVVLVGFSVAHHNALVEGVVIEREAIYIIIAVGSLTLAIVAISQLLYWSGHRFSFITLVLVVVIAITALMLYDGLRSTLDRIFYRGQFRALRSNMRSLAREASAGRSLPEQLNALLVALCRSMGIRRGFIALTEGNGFVVQVTLGSRLHGRQFPLASLATEEIRPLHATLDGGLQGAVAPPGLEDMWLLVPLIDGDEQLGALVLGRKQDGHPYLEDDLILLEDSADQLAAVIQTARLQEESAATINALIADFRRRERVLLRQVQDMLTQQQEPETPILHGMAEDQLVALTEDALRHLHDYPCLGEHPLAELEVLRWELEEKGDPFITHIDRGKALSKVIVRALNKLRPEGDPPGRHALKPREWHQFIVLHDAYVAGELNRDIMSQLHISQGTFNRTRRRALRGVAKALKEMELEAQRQLGERRS